MGSQTRSTSNHSGPRPFECQQKRPQTSFRKNKIALLLFLIAAIWLTGRHLPDLLSGDSSDLQFLGDIQSSEPSSLSKSWVSGEPVGVVLYRHLGTTLRLSSLSLIFALALTLAGSMLAFIFRAGRWIPLLCLVFLAVPLPWLGPLVWRLRGQAFDHQSILLPALVLASVMASQWIRWMYREMDRSLQLQAISSVAQFSRAYGYSEWRIAWRDGLRPNLGPLLGHATYQFGHLLGGAWITEAVFNLQGLGTLWVESFLNRDLGVVTWILVLVVSASLGFGALGRFLSRART